MKKIGLLKAIQMCKHYSGMDAVSREAIRRQRSMGIYADSGFYLGNDSIWLCMSITARSFV